MKKSLEINTNDDIKFKDEINTYKRWFNGLKHFFTVKVLPPPR